MGLGSIFKSVAKAAIPAATGYMTGGWGGAITGGLTAISSAQSLRDENRFNVGQTRQAQDFTRESARLAMDFGQRSADKSMDFTSAQALRQMGFQERMAGSQYQRGMADMRKAGLNPLLAYKQGGAASPAGASGSGSQASGVGAPGQAAKAVNESIPAIQTALAVQQNNAQVQNLKATTEVQKMQKNLVLNQAKKAAWEGDTAFQHLQKARYENRQNRLWGMFYNSPAGKAYFNWMRGTEAAGAGLGIFSRGSRGPSSRPRLGPRPRSRSGGRPKFGSPRGTRILPK